ncbi:hypothetical protein [Nonomuraea solani]|nr:hypothetical protein [Nonomuraea solani]
MSRSTRTACYDVEVDTSVHAVEGFVGPVGVGAWQALQPAT